MNRDDLDRSATPATPIATASSDPLGSPQGGDPGESDHKSDHRPGDVALTVSASLVASGVDVPVVWMSVEKGLCWRGVRGWARTTLDLSDPQTAFGLALKLDEWEGGQLWVPRLAHGWANADSPEARGNCLRAMLHRLTVIGQDAEIRRALGWSVEPGTLAEINCIGGSDSRTGVGPKVQWCWEVRQDGRSMSFASGPDWAGADRLCSGVGTHRTDEARAAIWREMTAASRTHSPAGAKSS